MVHNPARWGRVVPEADCSEVLPGLGNAATLGLTLGKSPRNQVPAWTFKPAVGLRCDYRAYAIVTLCIGRRERLTAGLSFFASASWAPHPGLNGLPLSSGPRSCMECRRLCPPPANGDGLARTKSEIGRMHFVMGRRGVCPVSRHALGWHSNLSWLASSRLMHPVPARIPVGRLRRWSKVISPSVSKTKRLRHPLPVLGAP